MIIDRRREKLLQAVVFFACHVRKLGKLKLFKLLYFFDFAHARETGRSVTGLDYYAWKMGPVPVALQNELRAPEPDWTGKILFAERPTGKGTMLSVTAQTDFDPSHFSRRELHLLEQLAAEFRDSDAEDMVEATHLENLPWHQVWVKEGARQALIPYELAFKKQDADAMQNAASDHSAMTKALSK